MGANKYAVTLHILLDQIRTKQFLSNCFAYLDQFVSDNVSGT